MVIIMTSDDHDIELIYKKETIARLIKCRKNLILVRSNRFLRISLLE